MKAFYHLEKSHFEKYYRDIFILKKGRSASIWTLYVSWNSTAELTPYKVKYGKISRLDNYTYPYGIPADSLIDLIQDIYDYYHYLPNSLSHKENHSFEDITIESLLTHPLLEIRNLIKKELRDNEK